MKYIVPVNDVMVISNALIHMFRAIISIHNN